MRTVGNAAVILAPRQFSSVCVEVTTRDIVVDTDFRTTDAAEERFGLVRASTVFSLVFNLVVHTLYREGRRQLIPVRRFICVHGRAFGDVSTGEGNAFSFTLANGGDGAAIALTRDDNDLTLTCLIFSSKKVESHLHMLSLYFVHYNFVRIHKTLKMTPAMAAGISDALHDIEFIVGLIDANAPAPKKRGPYKKKSANSN